MATILFYHAILYINITLYYHCKLSKITVGEIMEFYASIDSYCSFPPSLFTTSLMGFFKVFSFFTRDSISHSVGWLVGQSVKPPLPAHTCLMLLCKRPCCVYSLVLTPLFSFLSFFYKTFFLLFFDLLFFHFSLMLESFAG